MENIKSGGYASTQVCNTSTYADICCISCIVQMMSYSDILWKVSVLGLGLPLILAPTKFYIRMTTGM